VWTLRACPSGRCRASRRRAPAASPAIVALSAGAVAAHDLLDGGLLEAVAGAARPDGGVVLRPARHLRARPCQRSRAERAESAVRSCCHGTGLEGRRRCAGTYEHLACSATHPCIGGIGTRNWYPEREKPA
jgi:hypothetical protein